MYKIVLLTIDTVRLKQTWFQGFKTGKLYTSLVFVGSYFSFSVYTLGRHDSSVETLCVPTFG